MATKQKSTFSFNLYHEMIQECQAMAEYALASGKSVPETALQIVYDCSNDMDQYERATGTPKDQGSDGQKADSKKPKSTPVLGQQQGQNLSNLATAHKQLVEVVAPATPRALTQLATDAAQDSWWHILGPVPMIRRLVMIAVFFLGIFIATSLNAHVTGDADVSHSNGLSLLLNEIFLLSAAGLGATFAMLFRVNNAIADGTYDPRLDSSYWVKIVSGLVAGLLLATLIPIPSDNSGTMSDIFDEPVLALLGGFSSEFFLRLLNRLITSLESLVTDTTDAQVDTLKEMAVLNTRAAVAQERLSMATRVIGMQQELSNTPDSAQLKQLVNRFLGGLQDEPQQVGQLALEQKPSTPVVSTTASTTVAQDDSTSTSAQNGKVA